MLAFPSATERCFFTLSLNIWIFHFSLLIFSLSFVVAIIFCIFAIDFKQVESEGEKVKFLKVKNLNNPLAS